ncbi:MAG: aspartate kinase [bacterium]
MNVIVQKYGGSSVADVSGLRRVAERVAQTRRDGHRVVVVISAMGDTTDELLKLAGEVTANPPRRELDMLLTAGERIAMALLSMAIQDLGLDSISFTGSQSGILTNDRHANARIIEVRPYRVQDELERDRVVIVAGYQGVSYRREITTLGRGGSDTTAVALAAALGAERCEIYSDVDGVYSADPRTVDGARPLPEISYEEMQELSLAGAQVLNAQAVEFARRAGIVIYARATVNGKRETRVVVGGPPRSIAAGVAGAKDLVRLHVGGDGSSTLELAEALQEWDVTPNRISHGSDCAVVLLSRELCPDLDALLDRFQGRFGGRLRVERDLCMASVVGSGIGRNPRNLTRALRTLEAAGVPVLGVDTSTLRLSVFTRPEALDDGIRALHHEFVELVPDEG